MITRMSSVEFYNQKSQVILDTFYRGLENADKFYETIGGRNGDATFGLDGVKYILSKPIKDGITAKGGVNGNNVYDMNLKLRTEQIPTPEMLKEYSWHLDAKLENPKCFEFHENYVGTKYSQLTGATRQDKFAMEASNYAGLTNLEDISHRTEGGYSVMSKMTPEEFEMAKDLYEEIYNIQDLNADQEKLKKNLVKFNFNIASLAKTLEIDVPYKIIEVVPDLLLTKGS